MDWIDAATRLGFPVVSALGLAWAMHAFILRREKEAADREAALIAAVIKEREFRDTKMLELVLSNSKLADDATETNQRATTIMEAALAMIKAKSP